MRRKPSLTAIVLAIGLLTTFGGVTAAASASTSAPSGRFPVSQRSSQNYPGGVLPNPSTLDAAHVPGSPPTDQHFYRARSPIK